MLVYLDDILIFSNNEEEHVRHLKKVVQNQRKNQSHAKMAKCDSGKEKAHYLGHVVGKESIKVDRKKMKIVTKSHRPLAIG